MTKFERAAKTLTRWLREKNMHGVVAYDDPPNRNKLHVFLEDQSNANLVPKRWQSINVEVYQEVAPSWLFTQNNQPKSQNPLLRRR